jgi:hypothetical protein
VRIAFVSFASGVWAVVRAPHILLIVYALTLLVSLPFGIAMGGLLRETLNDPVMVQPDARYFSVDWWQSFSQYANGFERTFWPGMLGFAAPLGNISAILVPELRPLAVVAVVAIYGLLWAWLWGGVIAGFARGSLTIRTVLGAGTRLFPRMLALSFVALVIYTAVFWGLYPLMSGMALHGPTTVSDAARDIAIAQFILYAVFGFLLVVINVVVDYTRVFLVVRSLTLKAAFGEAIRFIRANFPRVSLLLVLIGAMFIALLTMYWLFERAARGAPTLSNAVLVGQLYILSRIALRLTTSAAEVRLVQCSAPVAKA